jgi:hypothetical protein
VRQLELDLFADPDGGLFAKPLARNLLINSGQDPGPDPNADGSLVSAGIKILHAAGFRLRHQRHHSPSCTPADPQRGRPPHLSTCPS